MVLLIRQGIGTVAALSGKLKLTDNAVRAHLASLTKEGIVRQSGLQKGSRRPHFAYEVTPRGEQFLTTAYSAALAELLAAAKQHLAPLLVRKLLRTSGRNLAKRVQQGEKPVMLEDRLRAATKVLENCGASIRAQRDHGKILLESEGCPLASVVTEHPEACLLIENFLADAIGARVRQRCHRGTAPRCRFEIRLHQ